MLPHPAPYTCHSNNTSITSVVTPASRNSITPRQPAPAHKELSLYSQVICPCMLHDSTPVPVHLNHQAMRSLYCTAADNFRYHRNAWMSATNPQVMQRSLESKTCNQVFNAIDGSWSTLLGVTLLQQAVAPNSIRTQRPDVQLHHGVDSRTQHCAMPTHEAQQACAAPHELWRMGTTTHKEWGHTLTVFQRSSSTRATAAQRDQYVWLVSAPEAQTDTIRVHLRLPHHNSATSAPPPPPHQTTHRHNSCCTAAAPPHIGLVSAVAVPLTQAQRLCQPPQQRAASG
ncbi:hypothetical protein COO60DRAFT_729173 [Scenedesmus sp. NREL 46B-D3]|nr:hypothetical protein COO60DRAFT_729173 [Scenedesmus sp. NREL 46B-D3]